MVIYRRLLEKIESFEWDEGNETKNYVKHGVSCRECEEIFFNKPFNIYFDKKHSKAEIRHGAFGRTDKDKLLFVVFTIRKRTIRIISARDQDKKERREYEKNKEDTQL